MVAVLAEPATRMVCRRAVLIAVGGPQYRAGSHRQFVLLARRLAASGFPALRFDFRGMGDSEGEPVGFEHRAPDLAAAIDALMQRLPSVQSVVVFGLCDAAAAALLACTSDPHVNGLVLLNPWVRSPRSLAQAHFTQYYRERILQPDFWSKLLSGGLDWRQSFRSLAALVAQLRAPQIRVASTDRSLPFQIRMAHGLRQFRGHTLLVLSERDLTAAEFLRCVSEVPEWKGLLSAPRVQRLDVPGADHTFSSASLRKIVEDTTIRWLSAW